MEDDMKSEQEGIEPLNDRWADNRGIQLIALATGVSLAGSAVAGYKYFSGTWTASSFYPMVIVWLTTAALIIRLIWAQRLLKQRRAYWISWTSAAVAPERTTVVATMLAFVLWVSTLLLPGEAPPLPEVFLAVLFGLFFGAPLFGMLVSQARAWQRFVYGEDPD